MNIDTLRRARGLTQIDLAEMTGYTQSTISRAEKCDDGSTIGVYKAIAAALQVDIAELFGTPRSAQEETLLRLFRSMPPDRQRGWLDLAKLALSEESTKTE